MQHISCEKGGAGEEKASVLMCVCKQQMRNMALRITVKILLMSEIYYSLEAKWDVELDSLLSNVVASICVSMRHGYHRIHAMKGIEWHSQL